MSNWATVIHKPQNTRKPWTCRYQLDGRRKEKSFLTKREAERFRNKFRHMQHYGEWIEPDKSTETFGVAATRWISQSPTAAATKHTYRSVLRNQLASLHDMPMSKLAKDRDGIRKLLVVELPDQGFAVSTIQTARKVIMATIRDAIASGRLSPNTRVPVIKLPRAPRRAEVYFPTHDELIRLSEAMPEPYGNLIWLIRGTGLRIGEAMAVKHEGFRPDGTLRITEQLLATGKLGPLKARSADDYRDVPVPQYVRSMMNGHGAGYIFPPVSRSSLTNWFNQSRGIAGLPPTFTFHSLRHVWASIALSEGIPLTDVSRWAGHSSVSFTADIYGHMVPAATDRARAILDREYADWSAGNEHRAPWSQPQQAASASQTTR